MGQVRVSLLFAMAAALVALAAAAPAGAANGCAARLIADWRDGRIDRTYPVACYREALAQLPEDLRVYSSASSDITRALQARVAQLPPANGTHARNSGGGVSPLLVVAVTAAILVAAGSVAAALR
jgi:hypothetical protein